MEIIINYQSCWQNSFLQGSNDELISKRKFKASSKSKEQPDVKPITFNTVLGVLCRLIGDQRKLYQAKSDDNFYFRNMPISFYITEQQNWDEIVMLINKSENRVSRGKFVGVLDQDEPLFFSEYAYLIWGVLDFNLNELLEFITQPRLDINKKTISVIHILNRISYDISSMPRIDFIANKIAANKAESMREGSKENPNPSKIAKLNIELENLLKEEGDSALNVFESRVKHCVNILEQAFEGVSYLEKNNTVLPVRLYCGAMYLMVNLMKTKNINVDHILHSKDNIQGISKRGFNGTRDFLNGLMGNQKITVKTPYHLSKSSGQLHISLDIKQEDAIHLKELIESAGVSAFYLGKKGLAYVHDIRI